jgi:hypothetical protein
MEGERSQLSTRPMSLKETLNQQQKSTMFLLHRFVNGKLKLDGFDPTKWCQMMSLKMIQNGRPRKQAGWYDELKLYYDNICNTDWVVTAGMMIYELKRLDPLLADVDTKVPSKRLYRWLRSE